MENKDLIAYAIFDFGGKQYQAVTGKTLALDKMDAAVGDQLDFDRVLLYRKDNSEVLVGRPFVAGVAVKAEVVSHTKGPKLVVFRFKRRKRIRVKNGHRQPHTVVRFKDFSLTALT